ncbi:30S ribosomal protein S4 [Nanoarchaeota archaeon]|nr:30S ribosomal protein S4 [Nanoarchaeota archaeon]RLG17602.1 MAG: 30S ribosomal protein S4 [Nanoarchaeota archaeon]
MGDPKKPKKKYKGPRHPWQKQRLEEERELRQLYGYKNKKELWKMESILRRYRAQARRLIGARTKEAEKEKKQLLDSLYRLGFLEKDAKLDDVLSLTIKDIMERRLQTMLFRKKLANSIKHARQLITHGHVIVGEKVITSPSFLVPRAMENKIRVRKVGG